MKKVIKISIISFFVVLLDQIIKIVVNNNIKLGDGFDIIKNFLYITNVHNEGAAWSILNGNVVLLIFISIIALLAIFGYLKKVKTDKVCDVLYAILIGGIIGNLLDRIIYKYVIDYIGTIIFGYYFPIFNLADICIVVSVIILFIKSCWEDICKKK